MVSSRIPVAGPVLSWARETASLDLQTAAQRIRTSPERLAGWENGEQHPTLVQLRKLAKVYSRPLGALMMPTPPEEPAPTALPDFRRPEHHEEVLPAALQSAVIRARRQREDLIEVSELLTEDPAVRSPGFKFSLSQSGEAIGRQLRDILNFDDISPSIISRPEDLFRKLVTNGETLGVLIIQVQGVSNDSMRGFSLAEEEFPVIALNGADWPRGKIFTLLHEMVHVGLRQGGLCDLSQASGARVERLCDAAAGAALYPAAKVLDAAANIKRPFSIQEMGDIGAQFGASGESALLRLVTLGRASWDDYSHLRPQFREAYRAYKKHEKDKNESREPRIYYQLKVRDMGRPYIRKVLQAYGEDVVSSRDLAVMLGVKFEKVPTLAEMVRAA